ncbi:hypothetical protein HPP92_001655 [Vanilla planifolia]|uniref:Secreted protein n=1 Tax=Vanilla planifolia TaxID=51239 RepID=A0A835RWN1_VANPL|nr:hypothetical protein HPP92_001655 [Vanilla planifolia]
MADARCNLLKFFFFFRFGATILPRFDGEAAPSPSPVPPISSFALTAGMTFYRLRCASSFCGFGLSDSKATNVTAIIRLSSACIRWRLWFTRLLVGFAVSKRLIFYYTLTARFL